MTSDIRVKRAVPAEQLRRVCAPVDTAADVPADAIGQNSALASVALGLKLSESDYALSHYNTVVVGPPNTGRTAKTLQFIRQYAGEKLEAVIYRKGKREVLGGLELSPGKR